MATTTETTVFVELCESELTTLVLALDMLRSSSAAHRGEEVAMLEEKLKSATRELGRKELASYRPS